ncbi:PP2C family protein-serine/threonine phosphatase [Cellulomonas cellasea]|uniref:PPM-type phosphatase domain-containing protein n=2 Tax=Cellulomonas cellasea TaxID=43670 RepID=A0A0A0BCA4_9CELL|nr:PP2C family protein-serine/threonine phosphatase [Cellulomonas cellasea]KGM03474.1 hypothetical protein Q760_03320 [Cellulomonas cellasea DSM 20118]GEA88937.1 phosphatase [Cellulomonas cellasea]
MTVSENRQRHAIRAVMQRAGLTTEDVWVRCFALGGDADPVELDLFLDGLGTLPALERDVVASVVNEALDELAPAARAPYVRRGREPARDAGALPALVELLRGAHLAPPDRLATVVDRAAQALGVRAVLYLVDYAGTRLAPVPGGAHAGGRTTLSLHGTLPGRAFRMLEAQSSTSGGRARLWIPVLDGVERLGVLDVMVPDAAMLEDPALHEQCWWFAHYLGHVLTGVSRYGDGLDGVRRSEHRTVAAELVWQLLPPLTSGTDRVLVSGRLEPSGSVGGDVFDVALSEEHAHVAIFDATGHDLGSGLVAATAVSAYRNARREGRSLFDQAQAVHTALVDQFGGATFATGVVARLDLTTGRLRYVAAGHPYPLVLRDGRVVRTLQDGRRTLFGLEATHVSVGEEQLEPGDIVVLYSDGITEARDARGVPFGADGLRGYLERQSGTGTPLPEVVRRLCTEILARQRGVLQDDATLVLVHWTTEGQLRLDPRPGSGGPPGA